VFVVSGSGKEIVLRHVDVFGVFGYVQRTLEGGEKFTFGGG
jgi:hypothetical protein